MNYFIIISIIIFALIVFQILPKISKKVSELEEKAMKQKLFDNNESNKYGALIVIIVLLVFLIIALVS
jgi:ABC-type phosphate transport system permease subunit